MLVYRFDQDTKVLLNEIEAEKDPLETKEQGRDVFLIPANCTVKTRPNCPRGLVCRFIDDDWVTVEDNRGVEYWLLGDAWNTPPRKMKDFGPLPSDAMLTAPEKPLSILKEEKLFEINASYNSATSAIVSTYPSTELLTFDKQEKEARSWDADNTVATPFLDGLALARGIDKAELVRRVIAKSDAFQTAVATLTGLRQRYEDQLSMATTAEEVAAIVPVYDI